MLVVRRLTNLNIPNILITRYFIIHKLN